MSESLQHLWKSILGGDTRAWERLVRRFNSLVYAVTRAHGLHAADAEDCVQQTWLALYTGRDRVENPASIPIWLVRVAKRKAQRLQQRTRIGRTVEEQFSPPSAPEDPEQQLIRISEAARLRSAVERLDSRCRLLLTALFFAEEELSYRDIADRMGIAPNSLGPTRSRCLQKLRKILEEIDEV